MKKSNIIYIIKSGDTLWGISRKYGCSLRDLSRANCLMTDVIYPGQKLKIPTKKQIKRWTAIDILKSLSLIILMLSAVFIIIYLGIKLIGRAMDYKPKECSYKYIDEFNREGEAKDCRAYWGSIYCTNNNKMIKVIEIEKVCK